MAKTINDYISDGGELEITISAADVAAMTELTTAEDIDLSGTLRRLTETQPESRPVSEVWVTGDASPLSNTSNKTTTSTWQVVLVDDYYKGAAGEWGTDLLAAVEIFNAFYDNNRQISALLATPAGGSTGDIQVTLVNCNVNQRAHPIIDADANSPNEITFEMRVESFSEAAHA